MAFSKNFVNSSLPDSKFTFVVNFDFSQVICQHSENKSDLHVHEMSILCDGKQDCFTNPAIHDESFPYCEKKCDSTCNNRGACLYDGERPQCYCNSGFSGPSCEFIDKNECLDRPCHLMADCLNTPVGFSCVCRPGFLGNGYHCADIDECSTRSLCPEHSNCVNLPGTHYCNCTEGFAQKGDSLLTKCLDINECELGSHNCGKNRLCENTIGGFNCVSGCTEGYDFVNGECVDVDECQREGICDPRAECFNSPGSYSCVCEDGMTGDGKRCEPITDCTQREDICDRHAQCIHPFKMCQCVAGFVGDGITCHDIDECEASVEPCKNQKGSRCVNIVGGHICCEEGSDDARCIEEKGVFCAGGCGTNAYCGNKTCECLPGYSGDPLKKCLDVNECDADNLCKGVGQWCVNIFGSFLCCEPSSKEPECQGVHIFKNSDGTTAVLHANHTKDVVVSAEQGENSVTQQGGFIAVGRGVLRANGSLPSISVLSRRACTSYCPINSECVAGYCECSKGFGGNPHLGCEDINECETGSPCGEITADNWCTNTEGGFTCCTRESPQYECQEGGLREVGGNKDDKIFHENINETSTVDVFSQKLHQSQNASEGGAILIVKQATPTDITLLKPENGELGLEITGRGLESTATEATVTLPGIVSTLGGLSSTTTTIPVTEIPIHLPEDLSTTSLKGNRTSNTTVLIIPSTLKPVTDWEGSGLEPDDERRTTTRLPSTLSGNINVHFTTLEEMTKDPNEPRTTVGESAETTKAPNTVIDGDETEEEALVNGKIPKKPKETTEGGKTGDVSVIDKLLGTTKKPTEKEPNPDKEGLEIIAKPTKPPTDVTTNKPSSSSESSSNNKENSSPKPKTSSAETSGNPVGSKETTSDKETGTVGSDKPDLGIDEEEKNGNGKDPKQPKTEGHNGRSSGGSSSSSSGTVVTVKEETKVGGDGQTLPEDAGRGVGITTPEQEGEAASTVPTTGETGLVIQWEGDKTTSGPSTESGPSSSIGSLLESTTVVSSESSTTTSPSEAKSANGESGQSFGTVVGKKDKPETDIHGGEGPETIQGEDGTKLTTVEPATTEEMGLEIIHEKTTSSLSVPDESSPGSTVFPTELTTSSPIISAPTEEKTTAGTVSVTIGSTETTTDGRTTEAGLEIIHETTPLTGQSTIQPKEEETTTREAETAGIEKTTKTEPPATTNGRDGETTAPALSAVEPTTTSAIEPEDAKEATLTSSSVGTTEGPALTAESSTKQTDLVLTVDTTTSSSSSSTKEESSPTTVTTSTEAASTPETGLEIVPEETTRSLESTTEQPDLVLTAGPTDAQTASSTLKEEPTTPPSTATTSSASSASPSTETTSTASSKGKTISSTQTAVPTAEGATPSTTAALISETASPSLGTKEATERPTSTLAAVSITPTDGTALPSSTTETPTTQPAVTELVSLNSGTTAAPTKTGSEQPPVNETTAGTATGGTAGPSSTSPNSQTPAVDITNLESTTRTPTADTSPNLSSETPAATSPSSAEGSASTSESSTLGTTDGTSALSSSTAPTSKGTTEGSTLKSSPETSETSVHPSTAAATSEVPSSSSATTEAATTQTQVADNQKETTGARGSSTTPVTPAITTEAATETTAGPSGQQTTVAKEPTVSSPGSVETSSTTTQPDLVLSVETTTTAEGTAPAGTKEESTTSAPSTAETFETAPGSIATKAPKKTVEVVTGGPDEDLTAAPTKQQRVPQTEFPAEPEGSTPWSTEEQTTKDVFSLPEKTTSPSATLGPSNVTKCVSSDECGDDALCERRTGACRCLPGFQGIPPSTPCSDVDECAEGLHKCHESARCHNIVGTYACFCPMGYRKNESGACIDIDECAESRGNCCSLNGTCVNKEGSYGCECKPGFFGDGYNCMPVEKRVCTEAELAKAGCGQHHVCMVDGLGGADCNTCKMGFKMVDGNCTDVNECAEPELNLCSRTADCNNLLGTYACSCKQGFRGDGYMCEDVDECGSNPCHPQAECENLLGSFKCSCPSGFTGDGIKECQNPLEKSCENVKDFCGRIEHVACLSVRIFNGSLSSVCECEPGFRFNKAQNTCEDINECEENRHNCDPASSVCVNEEGSFHCECAEGYEGVGGVCVDVNECERGTAGCHSMAMCLNQPGSCGCKCMQGFTGDGIQCNAVQKREEDNACTPEWDRLCMLENKTCHVDEEDVPQCGSCVEGHHPINGSCQPVHGAGTCSDPKKNTCDKNAECIDIPGTPGKHFCTCKKGFIGDGLRCDGPNCHLNGELCHKNAECTMDGQCKCKKGFEGDGFKECTEIASSPTTTAAVPSAETTTASPPGMTPLSFETTEIMPTTEADAYGSTPESEESTTSRATSTKAVSTTTTSATTTTKAPSTVSDDGIEVRTEPAGWSEEKPLRQGNDGRCSADNRSQCHEFAICDLSTNSCRCKDGFKGDGYSSCTQIITSDCVSNSSICHSDAVCDQHTRKCSCNAGHLGDGILCSPDPQDCVFRKDLCSTDAICAGRRCHCIEGFTGDGVKCVSLHQRSSNCSECDANAHCDQSVCSCNLGYFGNGLCCVPDPRDCVHFPGICHPEAACSSKSRQCVCNRGYLGDGISCFPAVSCVTDPYVCHKNALCLPSGHCMCRNGFEGNGHSCREMSALALRSVGHDVPSLCGNKCNKESELCIEGECICKHGFKKIGNVCEDVDECLKSPCHPLAFCQNSKGSYSCSCPEGYVGDGKTCIQHLKIGELGVFCENDGMTLVLSNDTQMFEGKMYVRGQAENPNCVKTFSSLQQHSRPYTFKVFFEHCNVHLLENNTFATTVIVQKHPHFITTSADSYELKCTYSPDIAQVQSHVNVSELSPTSTLSNQFEGPTCFLKITDERNDFVESAKVGQAMVLRLEVAPNGTYGILPRDCVAVNIETGERYQLTDRYGCAVDDQLFPEFNQIHPSVTEAIFRTFKWPDSSMIRFQCDCKACVGPCPAPDCQNLHKKMLPRFRRAHHGENEELDEEDADQKVVDTKRKAFSRLLAVHEDAEEQLAQEEVEHWSRGRSVLSESLPAVSQFEAEGVCVRTAVLAMAALLLVLSLGFLTSTALRRRRSTDSKSSDSPISVISF